MSRKKKKERVFTTQEIQQIPPMHGVAFLCEFVFKNRDKIVDALDNNYLVLLHAGKDYDFWLDYSRMEQENSIDLLYEVEGLPKKCYCVPKADALFNHDRINENVKALLLKGK